MQRKFSFEFFPPRTPEAIEKLRATQKTLAQLNPDFFSVTFGAGGGTRTRTLETVLDIRAATSIEAVPHLSCMGYMNDEIYEILERYKAHDIQHLVALRGDVSSGVAGGGYGQLRYASELVEFIRKKTGDHFYIEAAAYPEFHPQAPDPKTDLINFKRKVDAGVNSAITQYFYNPFAYYRFVESCQKIGIDIPIVPGIMPITNCTQLVRFSNSCGAEIPRWILKRLQEFGDDTISIQQFGIDVVSQLCTALLNNDAPGLHFYTMNQATASAAIWENLAIRTKTKPHLTYPDKSN